MGRFQPEIRRKRHADAETHAEAIICSESENITKRSHEGGALGFFPLSFEIGREQRYAEQSGMKIRSNYIVIGLFNRNGSIPKERLRRFDSGRELRQVIHSTTRELRGIRRFLSLKRVAGFGVYEVMDFSNPT